MAEDIYEGRCRDCFNKKPGLRELTDPSLAEPFVAGMKLCLECHAAREEEKAAGKQIRPIGISPDNNGMWVDLPPVTLIWSQGRTGNPIIVQAKVRRQKPEVTAPTENDGGDVVMKIGDNQCWVMASFMDLETPNIALNPEAYALSAVRTALRQRFSPTMVIKEEAAA